MPIFEETQVFRSRWLWATMGLGMLIVAVWFVAQAKLGYGEGFPTGVSILFVVGFVVSPFLLYVVRMHTKVDKSQLKVSAVPFANRTIYPVEIVHASIVTASLVQQAFAFQNRGSNKSLIACGDQAVQLDLTDGKRMTIGTQKPQELLAAIESIRFPHTTPRTEYHRPSS